MTQTQDADSNTDGAPGTDTLDAASTRAEEFEREIGDLRATAGSAAVEARMLVIGMICVAAGLVAIALGYWGAAGTAVLNVQISYLISGGIFGIGVTIVGAGLYLRFTTQRFFRFWLIRLVYEQRAQTDRIIEALERDRSR
ncbi:MAG: hypothetical protein R3A49_01255 [Acidimicrobiia bacterium]